MLFCILDNLCLSSCFLKASLCQSKYLHIWPAKVFCTMGLSRHVDYLPKMLCLTLSFITEDISTKDILKVAINLKNTTSRCFGQHLLFVCLKVFVISATSKTELLCLGK